MSGTAGRLVLAVLGGLALTALVPVLAGWQSVVVVSGSMAPQIRVGDIVVSRPLEGTPPQVGQVLVVDDPLRPGALLTHRLAGRRGPDLVLRGDANAGPDSSTTRADAVRGIGVLRIPVVGLPLVWSREHRAAPLAGLAVAIGTASAAVARADAADRRRRRPAGTAVSAAHRGARHAGRRPTVRSTAQPGDAPSG